MAKSEKPTVEELRDHFKLSYDQYSASRDEATRTVDYYHNRQYTNGQLVKLSNMRITGSVPTFEHFTDFHISSPHAPTA